MPAAMTGYRKLTFVPKVIEPCLGVLHTPLARLLSPDEEEYI